jgi:3-deoxy-7-phosphoheptulonate synthase
METLLQRERIEDCVDDVMRQLDPTPEYTDTYQPTYPNQHELRESIHNLHTIPAIATPVQVHRLLGQLGNIAQGNTDNRVVISRRCAEPISSETAINTEAAGITTERAIAMRKLGARVLYIPRAGLQAVKPRSNGPQLQEDGTLLYPYMGDGVNGIEIADRIPDPRRMETMAAYARNLRNDVNTVTGVEIPMAHEALLLPFEKSLVRVNSETGDLCLTSSEMVWGGVRTNGLKSGPMQLLGTIENPVGVKIGPNTKPGDIESIANHLNPDRQPGKLTFMLRVGAGNNAVREGVLQEIKDTAPGSVLLWDIHGSTRESQAGKKLRVVPEIIGDIALTARACEEKGLRLHGVHLESISVKDQNGQERLECVDYPDQEPTHPGGVDPQLNMRQFETVLGALATL